MTTEWQEIETVPKDGTPVDLWHKVGFRKTEVWWDDSDKCFSDCSELNDHTHWMPISCPPGERLKIEIANLRIGDKVHYQPEHYGDDKWENGLIKEIRDGVMDGVWVVYNCAGEWDRYQDYTSAKTNLRDLKLGWRH